MCFIPLSPLSVLQLFTMHLKIHFLKDTNEHTKCNVTLNASRHLSGLLSSSHKACPISATLFESLTSAPINRNPAQLAG